VPEELYPEIAANDAQWAEWERLFAVSELPSATDRGGVLRNNPLLVLDTRFFNKEFQQAIVNGMEELDASTDGVLVNGENFQALNLFQSRYQEQVQCIYIDPPYNTGDDGFPFKDSYQHSSWLSMMDGRLQLGRGMMAKDGVMLVSIDDHEVDRLRLLANEVLGSENFLAELVWEKGRKNDAKLVSIGHEYMLLYSRSLATLRERGVVWREPKPGSQEIWDEYISLRKKHGEDDEAVENDLREWYRRLPNRHPARSLSRYKHVDEHGPWRDRDISWPGGGGPNYEVLHPATRQPCRIPEAGWRFATPDSMQEQIRLGLVVFREDHTNPPFRKAHLRPIAPELPEDAIEADEDSVTEGNGESAAVGMQVMPSVIYKQSQVVTKKLRHMLGADKFKNPKDDEVISRLMRYCTSAARDAYMLDFFAGSGTAGHAVIDLNREDGGNRKYILVEMGEYFDSVLKPRILKAVYSKDWRDGKPVSREGSSHLLKYLTLESYEDTLNNLRLRERPVAQQRLLAEQPAFREDYLLSYCLDLETAGSPSLLDLDAFETPFDYTLTVTQGGESRAVPVDLPETFNYLLGLRVEKVRTVNGFHTVEGLDPDGARVLVIWRSLCDPGTDNAALDRFFVAQGYAGRSTDRALDRVYVNGDATLLTLRPEHATWQLLSTEEAFKHLMFAPITAETR
jgi:adenine-specific DNA-methyltransferase